ncbi:hypothetical protein LCGC14_3169210 [marine sediment metagenome]|uniref:Ferritin-like diiron domain-containing protein n=1 Tax=marine sediment metagenome TaxID=412755 RepID=A0A0F8XLJ8_9ZZZZ
MSNCSDGLLEIREAMKREMRGEAASRTMYQDMAGKFKHLGEEGYSDIFTLLSQAEQMHKQVIEGLIDAIDLRCGLPVSSKK